MGSSSSSTRRNQDPAVEASEQFNFRFTDCACKCDASKRRPTDAYAQNEHPQAVFLNALMAQVGQAQYDLRCDCDCGEGVKMGFILGNAPTQLSDTRGDR